MPGRPPTLVCPRCDYDLSGHVSGSAGPEERGLCPECGLDFLWLDVRDPERALVPWLYEHTPRGQIGFGRACRTLARTLMPMRFWRQVPLGARISMPRLLLWFVVLLAPMHLVWAAASIVRRWDLLIGAPVVGGVTMPQWRLAVVLDCLVHPLLRARLQVNGLSVELAERSYTFVMPLAAGLFMPVLLLLLVRSRATSKIRLAHIARSTVYGLAWVPCWYLLWTVVTAARAIDEAIMGKPPPFPRTTVFGWPIGALSPMAVLACMGWFGAWWWSAIIVGFQLKRGWLVWTLLMTACLLMGLVMGLLDREFGYLLGRWLG